MTLHEWLSAQKKLLEAATKGPWHTTGEYKNKIIQTAHITRDVWRIAECTHDGTVDAAFIASVRTEHDRALKIIEKYREALEWFEAGYGGMFGHQSVTPQQDCYERGSEVVEQALAYFPDDSEISDETK